MATKTDYVPLRDSKSELRPDSHPAGPINRSEVATITVRVRSVGDVQALERKVYELSKEKLEDRTYLTYEQLVEQYGASEEDLNLVEQHAQKYNVTVVRRSEAERSIVLRGTLGDLLDAFPADVKMCDHCTGTYRAQQGEIYIPQHLNDVIIGIFGFDTRPNLRHGFCQQAVAASGPGGANGVAATEYAKRYKFPTTANDVPLDGSGQTIAIIELGGGFQTDDLKDYFKEIGIPLPNVVYVDAGIGKAPVVKVKDDLVAWYDGEVMLDIEAAGAVAPKAEIAVYFAHDAENQSFIAAIRAAVHDTQRKPSVISISWGSPESPANQQAINEFHQLFLDAAALGITVCVASGDYGTADEAAKDWDGHIHVDHPAADPLVLSCGGTQIDEHGNDVVWNGDGCASGGGISKIFPVPEYQLGANLPASIDKGEPSHGRGVPDIAMCAVNYFVRSDGNEENSGGTSAVAPLMAALVARLNQAKKKNVGFMNPFFYANAHKGIVHDVTVGDNAIPGQSPGYKAGPGWNACTGLGTVDGMAILKNL
ncbi:peptidase S53 propeptide [Dissophora ornata]|nr:peptidase S53 propeptide [Dissophora ornata]